MGAVYIYALTLSVIIEHLFRIIHTFSDLFGSAYLCGFFDNYLLTIPNFHRVIHMTSLSFITGFYIISLSFCTISHTISYNIQKFEVDINSRLIDLCKSFWGFSRFQRCFFANFIPESRCRSGLYHF